MKYIILCCLIALMTTGCMYFEDLDYLYDYAVRDTGSDSDTETNTDSNTSSDTHSSNSSDAHSDSETSSDTNSDTQTVCVQCVSDKFTQCYSGDVWQYGNSSGIDIRTVVCNDACEKCVNIDDRNARCDPIEVEAYQQCGLDDNVHWFNSCGAEGEIATTCDSCKMCANTDSENATCVAKPDFTACELITSPDRQYDICVTGTCVSPGCGTADCNAPGPYFPLPDSGQRTCYSQTDSLASCPTFDENYFGQDAQFGWDFTHAADERFTIDLNVSNEPVVTDNVTDLIWQGCTGGLEGDECDNVDSEAERMLWVEAIAYCENLEWGGHDDWRLPDEYALQTIVDYGTSKPAINQVIFPYTENSYYWTSSSNAHYESLGNAVYFDNGSVYHEAKDWGYYARCIRSEQMSRQTFERSTAPGELVVTDTLNQLMWQGCSAQQTNLDCTAGGGLVTTDWKGALFYCENLSWAGHDDWRLPSVIELFSIINNHVNSPFPSIDENIFPETGSDSYWTSSSNPAYELHALFVNFDSGYVGSAAKNSYSHTRCVRDVE